MNKKFTPFRIFCEIIYLLTIVVVGSFSGFYISRYAINFLNGNSGNLVSFFIDSERSDESN